MLWIKRAPSSFVSSEYSPYAPASVSRSNNNIIFLLLSNPQLMQTWSHLTCYIAKVSYSLILGAIKCRWGPKQLKTYQRTTLLHCMTPALITINVHCSLFWIPHTSLCCSKHSQEHQVCIYAPLKNSPLF